MKKNVSILTIILALFLPIFAAQTINPNIIKTTPTEDFIVHGDGTVTHKTTGLMWKVASEGHTWTSGTVSGTAAKYNWQGALDRATSVNGGAGQNHGYTDWRVPTIKELASIVEYAAYSPAINITVFPNTTLSWYWSSSANANNPSNAWLLYFHNGRDSYYDKSGSYYVRLVR